MKILVCPLNGPRPISEFAYGGEVRPSPDPNTCSDAEWSSYVFNRSGSPGAKYEWWCHIASGFTILRCALPTTEPKVPSPVRTASNWLLPVKDLSGTGQRVLTNLNRGFHADGYARRAHVLDRQEH